MNHIELLLTTPSTFNAISSRDRRLRTFGAEATNGNSPVDWVARSAGTSR
jgi:hypothetical protein